MIGLLDGDIVVFRCGFAAERNLWHLAWAPIYETAPDGTRDLDHPEFTKNKTFEYKREAMEHLNQVLPGEYSRVEGQDYLIWPERDLEPLEYALNNVKTLINRICRECDLNPEFDLKVYLSEGTTFRHELAVTRPYKGKRKAEHRPHYEKEIRNYIIENYDTTVAEGEEADDLMGIAQTKYGPEESIIITMDKDLDQVPGLKYNWKHDVKYNITPGEGTYNFHMQLMTGDATDNIPGLPGIGPGKAAKALHGLESEEEQMHEVVAMYQVHSGKEDWFEYLTEQGRLLWIRREVGQLWEPPLYATEPVTLFNEADLTLEVD